MFKIGDRVADISNIDKVGVIRELHFDYQENPYYNIEWDNGEIESLYVGMTIRPPKKYVREYYDESFKRLS
tara:strand:- start:49 stop:261 length:213 start_codon:yes stop_codon:yes gene_type:complete